MTVDERALELPVLEDVHDGEEDQCARCDLQRGVATPSKDVDAGPRGRAQVEPQQGEQQRTEQHDIQHDEHAVEGDQSCGDHQRILEGVGAPRVRAERLPGRAHVVHVTLGRALL